MSNPQHLIRCGARYRPNDDCTCGYTASGGTPSQSSVSEELPTDEMVDAGVAAFNKNETLSVRRLLKVAFPAMLAARPTADLGEDQDLVERLRRTAVVLTANQQRFAVSDHMGVKISAIRQAADRIEALHAELLGKGRD